VIGAGPTGGARGALAEIARHALIKDFRTIRPENARVILLEGKDRVLPPYPPDLSAKAQKQLEELGVEVITDAIVTDVNDHEVRIGDRVIPTHTILWGAGVQASPLAKSLGVPLDRAGRVIVESDLTIPGHNDVFVLGDLAAVEQYDGSFAPGVAPGDSGRTTHGEEPRPRGCGSALRAFKYWDKGSLATIGRAAAVADLGRFHFGGFSRGWPGCSSTSSSSSASATASS
jgi:NADH dehydrogenase